MITEPESLAERVKRIAAKAKARDAVERGVEPQPVSFDERERDDG